jgi:uncharacterized protein YuzE
MRVRYDQDVDAVTIELKPGAIVEESDEMKPGVILDFDESGDLVAIEVLDASKRMTDPATFDFQIKTPQHT